MVEGKWDLTTAYIGLASSFLPYIAFIICAIVLVIYNKKRDEKLDKILKEIEDLKKKF